MNAKNIVLFLGIIMVCIGTFILFLNGEKGAEMSDAEIKRRAEMLGMVEPKKDAILTSELENTVPTNDIENNHKLEEENQEKEQEDKKDLEEETENKTKVEDKESDQETLGEKEKDTNKKTPKKKKANKKKKNHKEENTKIITITINSGMTAEEICQGLEEEGLVEDAEDFRQYLVKKNIQRKLQAGTFEIKDNADYDEIIASIYKG